MQQEQQQHHRPNRSIKNVKFNIKPSLFRNAHTFKSAKAVENCLSKSDVDTCLHRVIKTVAEGCENSSSIHNEIVLTDIMSGPRGGLYTNIVNKPCNVTSSEFVSDASSAAAAASNDFGSLPMLKMRIPKNKYNDMTNALSSLSSDNNNDSSPARYHIINPVFQQQPQQSQQNAAASQQAAVSSQQNATASQQAAVSSQQAAAALGSEEPVATYQSNNRTYADAATDAAAAESAPLDYMCPFKVSESMPIRLEIRKGLNAKTELMNTQAYFEKAAAVYSVNDTIAYNKTRQQKKQEELDIEQISVMHKDIRNGLSKISELYGFDLFHIDPETLKRYAPIYVGNTNDFEMTCKNTKKFACPNCLKNGTCFRTDKELSNYKRKHTKQINSDKKLIKSFFDFQSTDSSSSSSSEYPESFIEAYNRVYEDELMRKLLNGKFCAKIRNRFNDFEDSITDHFIRDLVCMCDYDNVYIMCVVIRNTEHVENFISKTISINIICALIYLDDFSLDEVTASSVCYLASAFKDDVEMLHPKNREVIRDIIQTSPLNNTAAAAADNRHKSKQQHDHILSDSIHVCNLALETIDDHKQLLIMVSSNQQQQQQSSDDDNHSSRSNRSSRICYLELFCKYANCSVSESNVQFVNRNKNTTHNAATISSAGVKFLMLSFIYMIMTSIKPNHNDDSVVTAKPYDCIILQASQNYYLALDSMEHWKNAANAAAAADSDADADAAKSAIVTYTEHSRYGKTDMDIVLPNVLFYKDFMKYNLNDPTIVLEYMDEGQNKRKRNTNMLYQFYKRFGFEGCYALCDYILCDSGSSRVADDIQSIIKKHGSLDKYLDNASEKLRKRLNHIDTAAAAAVSEDVLIRRIKQNQHEDGYRERTDLVPYYAYSESMPTLMMALCFNDHNGGVSSSSRSNRTDLYKEKLNKIFRLCSEMI